MKIQLTEEKQQQIVARIEKLTKEKVEHIDNERFISAKMVDKSIKALQEWLK